MIKFLQSGNKAAKYLLGGLMLVVCLSMVTYLIPGFMSGTTVNRTGVLASVAGHEITTTEVQQAAQLMMRQRRQRVPEQYMGFIMQQEMRELIQEAELRYAAERLGLRVSDEEVREQMRHGPDSAAFFPGGKWVGEEQYEQMLTNAGFTTESYESGQRLQLLARKLQAAVTAGATVSPAEVEKAYKDENTKVKFDYAVIKRDDVEKEIKPTDAELKAFYDANKARYQNSIPEKRQVRYFLINDKDVANKITVTPTDIDRYYRANLEQYRTQDRVRVRHILIATPKPGPDGKVDQKGIDQARAKAADILKQIRAGADFAELAKKYSDDPGSKEQGGEMPWIVKGQTVAEFEKVAFSQNKGQISDLVQTQFGFHIIQTEDKEVAHVKSLAEVKDSIEQTIRQQKLSALLDQMANSAEADARSEGLDKAAAKFGSQVIETNPIARTDSLAGVGAAPEVMSNIFTADLKTPPESVRSTQGAVVVFQVARIIPPRTPELEEIKDRVTTDFKSERASTLLTQKTTELSDRAHAEHDLHKAAKESGATVKTSDLVGRASQVPDVGSMSGAANVAFTMEQGDISGPLNTGRDGVVLQVLELQQPALSGDEFTKAEDGIRDQLLEQKRQEAMQLFMSNLNERLDKEGKVKINNNEVKNLTQGRS